LGGGGSARAEFRHRAKARPIFFPSTDTVFSPAKTFLPLRFTIFVFSFSPNSLSLLEPLSFSFHVIAYVYLEGKQWNYFRVQTG
jgi:hypothetical protein